MSDKITQDFAFNLRLQALEQFKIGIEKELHGWKILAKIFGIAGFILGGGLGIVLWQLVEIGQATRVLKSDVATVQESFEKEKAEFTADKLAYSEDLRELAETTIAEANIQLDETLESKRTSVESPVGTSFLTNGKAVLNIRKLTISNENGKPVAEIGTANDSSGNVFLYNKEGVALISLSAGGGTGGLARYYSKSGKISTYIGTERKGGGLVQLFDSETQKPRFEAWSQNGITLYEKNGRARYKASVSEAGRPFTNYLNEDGKVISMGAFEDSGDGYFSVFNPSNGKKIGSFKGAKEGSQLVIFDETGDRQLVYAGSASNTGDGFVEVRSRYGDKEKELAIPQ